MKPRQRKKRAKRTGTASKVGSVGKTNAPLIIDLESGITEGVTYPLRRKKKAVITREETAAPKLRKKTKIQVASCDAVLQRKKVKVLAGRSHIVLRTRKGKNLHRVSDNAGTIKTAVRVNKKKRCNSEGESSAVSMGFKKMKLRRKETSSNKEASAAVERGWGAKKKGVPTRERTKDRGVRGIGRGRRRQKVRDSVSLTRLQNVMEKKEEMRSIVSAGENTSKQTRKKGTLVRKDHNALKNTSDKINKKNFTVISVSDTESSDCVVLFDAKYDAPNNSRHVHEINQLETMKTVKKKSRKGKKTTNSAQRTEENVTSDKHEVEDAILGELHTDYSEYLETPRIDYVSAEDGNDWTFSALLCSEEQNSLITGSKYRVEYQMLNGGKFVMAMKHPCSVFIRGKINIHVVKGEVEVSGSTITAESGKIDLYSPVGYSLMGLKTRDCQTDMGSSADAIKELADDGLSPQKSKEYFYGKDGKEFHVVLILGELETAQTRYLECFIDDLFSCSVAGSFPEIEEQLHCCVIPSDHICTQKFYSESPVWKEVVHDICTGLSEGVTPILVACGGKGVGKSTFLRYVINSCLPSVDSFLYIDLDPGQSEFTVPGCVSAVRITKPVLGPNFTHFLQPERMVFVGDVNIGNCPTNYLQSVRYLVESCQQNQELASLPWIVNTMGFCTSIGVDLNIDAIRLICPTHLVQLESCSEKRNFSNHLTPEFVSCCRHGWVTQSTPDAMLSYKHTSIDSLSEYKWGQRQKYQSQKPWGAKPAKLRETVVLSYLSQMLSPETPDLLSVVPYRLSWSSVAVHVSHEPVPPTHLLSAINGNLVALCCVKEEDMLCPDDVSLPRTLQSTPVAPCYGFGLVRGIDPQSKMFYIITPEPNSRLSEVNCLIMGNVFLPQSLYSSFEKLGHIPYIVTSSTDQLTSQAHYM